MVQLVQLVQHGATAANVAAGCAGATGGLCNSPCCSTSTATPAGNSHTAARSYTKTREKPAKPSTWPPPHLSLPDVATLEALSGPGGGRVVQGRLFPVVPDDGKVARLRRLLGTGPGRSGYRTIKPKASPQTPAETGPGRESVDAPVDNRAAKDDTTPVGQSSAAGKG
jgi:hypothetical protein